MPEKDVEIALLRNDFEYARLRQEELERRLSDLIAAVEKNNNLIENSRGIVFGASLAVSIVWAGILGAMHFFSKT